MTRRSMLAALGGALLFASVSPAEEPPPDSRMDIFFSTGRPAAAPPALPAKGAEAPRVFEALEASQAMSGGFVYEPEELYAPLSGVLEESGLSEVKGLLGEDKYLRAYQLAGTLLVSTSASGGLISFGNRLELVKESYPELDPSKGQWARALDQGISDFLRGRDEHAVLRVSYALSLNPVAPGLSAFLGRLEDFTGRKGRRIPTGTGLSLVEVKLNEAEAAFAAGRLDDVLRLSRDVLVLKPRHATALSRLGSALFLKGRPDQAAAVWQQAMELETRPQEREALAFMLAKAEAAPLVEALGRPGDRPAALGGPYAPRTAGSGKAPAAPGGASVDIREAAPKASAEAARRPSGKGKSRADPKALDELYRKGFAAYTKGDWQTAAECFRKMEKLDPANAKARKALRRLESDR